VADMYKSDEFVAYVQHIWMAFAVCWVTLHLNANCSATTDRGSFAGDKISSYLCTIFT